MKDELMVFPEGDMNRFLMDEITVDGIKSRNQSLLDLPMFSMKYEETGFGDEADTGRPMHWAPWTVSEKHWLSCAAVMPIHAKCIVCGERD